MAPWRTWQHILALNGIGTRAAERESGLGKLGAILVYAGIFLRDILSVWIYTATGEVLLVLGLFCGFSAILLDHLEGKTSRLEGIHFAAMSVLVWLIGSTISQTLNTSAYFLAPVIAFVLINTAPRTLFALLAFHLFLTIGVQAIEYSTGSYLYVYETKDGIAIDEVAFGGSWGIFRAKGLFPGPLNAVAFAAWFSFFYRGSFLAAGLLLLSSFLASGRLGMIVAVLLLLLRLRSRDRYINSTMLFLGTVPIASCIAYVVATADADRVRFISAAFDQESTGNVSRVYFWIAGIHHYLSYEWPEMLFGQFGFIRAEEGATENDFLRIALDNGMADLLIYLAALQMIFRAALWQRSTESLLTVMFIVGMFSVFPFIQSLNSALLFWMFVFVRMRALKAPKGQRWLREAPRRNFRPSSSASTPVI